MTTDVLTWPSPLERLKDAFEARAKRKKLPHDPKWDDAKTRALQSFSLCAMNVVLATCHSFLTQEPAAVFNLAAQLKCTIDTGKNLKNTYQAAEMEAIATYLPEEKFATPPPVTIRDSKFISFSRMAVCAFSLSAAWQLVPIGGKHTEEQREVANLMLYPATGMALVAACYAPFTNTKKPPSDKNKPPKND